MFQEGDEIIYKQYGDSYRSQYFREYRGVVIRVFESKAKAQIRVTNEVGKVAEKIVAFNHLRKDSEEEQAEGK